MIDIQKLRFFFMMLFRKNRVRLFQETLKLNSSTRVLDVGGTDMIWKLMSPIPDVTILNLNVPEGVRSLPRNITYQKGDGRKLPYDDQSFDVVFSNSVIEHLHCYEDQVLFAKEIMRVGKKIWVQTPARWFFVEPHLLTPFIHYLPKTWQQRLLRNFTVWGLMTRPSQESINKFLDEVRLLTYKEMRSLFPQCRILREKFLFLNKSYIAVHD